MSAAITYFRDISQSYQTHNLESISPDFELAHFEDFQDRPSMVDKPFRLNAFIVGMVTDGTLDLTVNSKQYSLKAGSLYFLTPWHIRKYSNTKDLKGYILMFTPQYLFHYRYADSLVKEFPFFQSETGVVAEPPEPDLAKLIKLFDEMHGILHSDSQDKFKILFHYVSILLFSCKTIDAIPVAMSATTSGNGETVLSQFADIINNYFMSLNKGEAQEALTLNNVSRQMYLHPNYLSSLLKSQTGKTAAQLIRERIVLEAQALLKNTSMTVSEIAFYLHFKDTSNFAKFFRNQIGASPSDFRMAGKQYV